MNLYISEEIPGQSMSVPSGTGTGCWVMCARALADPQGRDFWSINPLAIFSETVPWKTAGSCDVRQASGHSTARVDKAHLLDEPPVKETRGAECAEPRKSAAGLTLCLRCLRCGVTALPTRKTGRLGRRRVTISSACRTPGGFAMRKDLHTQASISRYLAKCHLALG